MGIEMGVTEFKAKCLELFDKLSRNEIDSISVTKRGNAVGTVLPPKKEQKITREEALAHYWEMVAKNKSRAIKIDPDFDETGPIFDIEDSHAYRGKVFPDDE